MVSAASQGLTNTNLSTAGLFLDQKLQQAVGLKENNPGLKAYMSSNQPNSQNVSFIHQTGTSMNNNNTSVVYS